MLNVAVVVRGGFWQDVAKDMQHGLDRMGHQVRLVKSHDSDSYRLASLRDADWIVSIGRLGLPGDAILQASRLNQKWLYVDHAYYGRYRYFRVSRQSLYWPPYALPEPDWTRWERQKLELGIEIQPWRKQGEWVVLLGSGTMAPEWSRDGWMRHAIDQASAATEKPIRYRPKPAFRWPSEEVPEGMVGEGDTEEVRLAESLLKNLGRDWEVSVPARQTLAGALWDAHALVSLHSNACLDALILGVPGVVLGEAPAKALSGVSWQDLADPPRPKDPAREVLFASLSGLQFNREEMAEGLPWRRLVLEAQPVVESLCADPHK